LRSLSRRNRIGRTEDFEEASGEAFQGEGIEGACGGEIEEGNRGDVVRSGKETRLGGLLLI